MANTFVETESREAAADVPGQQNKLKEINDRIAAIMEYIGREGASAPASFLAEVERLDSEKALLESEIAKGHSAAAYIDPEAIIANIRAAVESEGKPLEKQKTAIQNAIKRVTIYDDTLDVTLDSGSHGGGGGNRNSLH